MGHFSQMACDYENENYDEIVEDFINENEKEFETFKSLTHYRNEDEVVEWFVEEKKSEFDDFVLEHLQDALNTQADMNYYMMRDNQMEMEISKK